MMEWIVLAVFGLLMLSGVAIIVLTDRVIHAVYALALVLVCLAGIYVFLFAELLAVVQLLLYAGGVVILLVFGVMMTNRLRGEHLSAGRRNVRLSALISVLVFGGLVYLFSSHEFPVGDRPVHEDQVKAIGTSFFTDHLLAFELIAFVLLVALVGASYLAKQSSDE